MCKINEKTVPWKLYFGLVLLFVCGISMQAIAEDTNASDPDQFFDMSLEQLMDVEVYGASKYKQKISDAPSSISVVTADEIQTYGYRTLVEILSSLRGFYSSYDRNYNYLGVRGFGRPGDYNSRILLLVDGRKVNDNLYESASIGNDFLVDVDLIDRVEVIRGPGSSLYGSSAFFAVVNVITKNPTDYNGAEVSTEISKWETYKQRATYGTKFDNGTEAMVSSTYYDSAGDDHYYSEFSGEPSEGWAKNADGERARSFFAKLIRGDWTFETAYVDRDKNMPTGPWYGAGMLFNDNRSITHDKTGFFDLKYNHEFENELGFMARFFYGWYDYDGDYVYDDTPPYINDDYLRSKWYGTELQFTNS